ncbi:ANL_HP_G0117860.mRNA.1.CDS.1 [Saccharomyces cerevisiae]|nr:ANL_HP_G0117860.mRNA.1.CDS.1 [Saccharomyces cerevisiae]CAI6987055.1 ANL_HP_G0117860.mRNA.1.CDS.1 [Saccharomyces cerevisiae]
MFGPFKLIKALRWVATWKIHARIPTSKTRQRERLRNVDQVIKQLTLGLHVQRCQDKGLTYQEAMESKKKYKPRSKSLRLLNKPSVFPKENQMSSKDKYWTFDKKAVGYRKGIHKVPKWTKISIRKAPKVF